jgi:X-Pro dipeptidyl-peptidase (S15 family)
MQIIDESTKTCGFQAMVAMRDGARLNTFVFLPGSGGPRWPVILHRTPYGITAADASDKTDVTKAWLPSREEPLRGSIPRGWRNIVAHGYAAVYQDTRGRHGSEGEDRVYADDAADGRDTLDWIASQAVVQSDRGHVPLVKRALRRLSPRPRRATLPYARFSLKPAPPASMTMLSTKANRSRWSGCGPRSANPPS